MADLTVAGFLAHHRHTVVPVGVAMMSRDEYALAIKAAHGGTEAEVYDRAMAILKCGPMPEASRYVTAVGSVIAPGEVDG